MSYAPAIKIGICGVAGRMGKAVAAAVHNDLCFQLVGGATRQYPIATPLAEIVRLPLITALVLPLDRLFAESNVVIDFSSPEALKAHLEMAKVHHTRLVIGTTGLGAQHKKSLRDASAEVPIVYSQNMSPGIILMAFLVEKAAGILDENYDIEIYEQHHRHKKDAPSGTALFLSEAAAHGRQQAEKNQLQPYHHLAAPGPRQKGRIGFSVSRAGGEPGFHQVSFTDDHESLRLTHQAYSRDVFALGALKAARWLAEKTEPNLYNMRQVLGLEEEQS